MDLALTKKGDLKFTEETPDPFKVSFNISTASSLKVGFTVIGSQPIERPEEGLAVNLKLLRYPGGLTKLDTVDGRELLEQKIKAALWTERGELYARNIGSTLSELRHERVDSQLLKQVRLAVEEAVEDFLSNAEVRVKQKKDPSLLYQHNLIAEISTQNSFLEIEL